MEQLKNPPLIEALLEIKWDLKRKGPDTFDDPGFRLASGRLFDRISKKFGFFKELPIAIVPEEMTAYNVRHQFRAKEEGWPLVQHGPGVATVNLIPPYSWKEFKDSVKYLVPHLIKSYGGTVPTQPDYQLNVNSVLLRYINGIEWDWSTGNTLDYIEKYLHTDIKFPDKMLKSNNSKNPSDVNMQIGFPVEDPKGQIILRFSTGTIGQSKGLVFELLFLSTGEDAPKLYNIDEFLKWLDDAHKLLEQVFFVLIEGKLQTQFTGG